MSNSPQTIRFRFWLWLIRLIGVIVPRRLRADWRQEWEAELRYRETLLAEWDKLDWRNKLDLLRRSLGAFWDALLLQPRRLEDEMFQDLRFGIRMLLKSPLFTLVALGTLAVGTGANAALFSVVNATLLRPLPYPEAGRVVRVFETTKAVSDGPVSPPNFVDWREQSQAFDKLAAYQGVLHSLIRPEGVEQVQGLRVSAELFPLLGVTALHGRTFLAEEDKPGATRVVVLSHTLWQSQFGGDPNLIGRAVRLGEQSYTVVGVLPSDFEFQSPEIGLWTPLALGDASHRMKRTERYLQTIARLRPGVTLEQAQTEMSTVAARLAQTYPDANASNGVRLVPLQQHLAKRSRTELLLLLGAVGCVLLIACANIANLLLARAAMWHKELAIRSALGASRLRVARQLLTESLLLSLLGGLAGLLLAYWAADGLSALLRLGGNDFAFAVTRLQQIGVDGRVLCFTLLVSLVTGVIFGLAPAFQSAGVDLNQTLKGVRINSGGTPGRRFRQVLVVVQTGLALVLLLGAGLLLKSFWRLNQVDLGFDPQPLLTMQVSAPPARPNPNGKTDAQGNNEYIANFFRALTEHVKTAPGVADASLISFAPLTDESTSTRFTIEHRPPASPAEVPTAGYRVIAPGYFQTLGVPLPQGRHFTDADTAQAPASVIINETLARRFWPGANPLNQRIRRGGLDGFGPWYTVVGVVKDVKTAGPEAEVRPELYIPHAQFPWGQMTLVARLTGDPVQGANELRAWIRAFDKTIAVTGARPLEQLAAHTRAARRFNLLLLGAFALLALLLAAGGLYGVISYSVAQRKHELGIRAALGALPADLLRLVIGQGMKLALVGVVVGLTAALGLTRLMKGLLFEVSPTDPLTFATIALLLTGVAFLACYLPARRAASVDPLAALRDE